MFIILLGYFQETNLFKVEPLKKCPGESLEGRDVQQKHWVTGVSQPLCSLRMLFFLILF